MLKISIIPCVAALLVLGNYLLVKGTGSEAWVSEVTQYGNIQRCLDIKKADKESVIVVGSSIAGRFFSQYFKVNREVYNFGIDSGSTTAGLEYLKSHEIFPHTVIVELNRLDMSGTETSLARMNDQYGKKESQSAKLKFLQPNVRPSSVIYQKIKNVVDQRADASQTPDLKIKNGDLKPIEKKETSDSGQEIISLLEHFRMNNCKLIIVDVPSNMSPDPVIYSEVSTYTQENKILFLTREMAEVSKPTYSDGIHLTLPSARRYCHLLSGKL